jgi:hypothetical protein
MGFILGFLVGIVVVGATIAVAAYDDDDDDDGDGDYDCTWAYEVKHPHSLAA